jgi:hypothetical protein
MVTRMKFPMVPEGCDPSDPIGAGCEVSSSTVTVPVDRCRLIVNPPRYENPDESGQFQREPQVLASLGYRGTIIDVMQFGYAATLPQGPRAISG